LRHFTKYLAASLIFLAACGSNEVHKTDIGLDYFPLRKGFYQIYQVDGTQYSEVADPQAFHHELMVEVVDSFPNTNNSGYTYVIYRSERDDATSEWTYKETWSARIEGNEVVQNEGNASYVKLILPIKNGTTWNGNKYNNMAADAYLVKMVDEPQTVNGITFDKALVIEQEKNEDPIVFRDIRIEYYARGAGLIYKEFTQLNYCTDNDCLGQQQVKSGVTYVQKIKEHGVH